MHSRSPWSLETTHSLRCYSLWIFPARRLRERSKFKKQLSLFDNGSLLGRDTVKYSDVTSCRRTLSSVFVPLAILCKKGLGFSVPCAVAVKEKMAKISFWYVQIFYAVCEWGIQDRQVKSIETRHYVSALLLLSSSSSLSSPLCRVFILIFLRQTMSLGNTVL